MNKDQSVTWELLLILGIVVLLMSPVGTWIGSIILEITTHHNVNLSLNPFQSDSTTMGTNQLASSGGGGSNAPVGHYVVNLAGGGQMNVNANSPQAAVANVSAEGGTPA
jgi:hypothetical protein